MIRRAAQPRDGQYALPLDWSAAGSNALPVLTGPSNAAAVKYLASPGTWPVRTAILTGPRQSGRSLMARGFALATGARVIDPAPGQPLLGPPPAAIAETALFHAWNAAQAGGPYLLIVADTPPGDWQIALPDLASRLRAVPVLRIGDPDDRLASELIAALLAQRGLMIGEDVAAYITRRIARSHGAILAAATVLDQAALARGQPVGKRLAADALIAAGLMQADLVDTIEAASAGAGAGES